MTKARIAVFLATMALVAALPPGGAAAHNTNSFEACSAFTAAARYCAKVITIVRGDTVWFRAKAKPPHGGMQVVLQRQNAGRSRWFNECQSDPMAANPCPTLSDGGRVKTSWDSGPFKPDDDDAYHFRWKIPEHGISNTLNVWVFRQP
jgi:hypothetical protein